MARRFGEVEELLDDALELPVEGKVYRIPSPSAEDGLKIQAFVARFTRLADSGEDTDTEVADDAEEIRLIETCLGPAHEEMVANGVSWSWRRHAGLTAMWWVVSGPEFAERFWKAAGDPSRMAPNRETRRAAAKKSGSAAASKTRSRGSTSGTRGRRATASSQRAAKTSPGQSSSPSGS